MIALIDDNRETIIALCEQFGVQRLAVFGSAVKGTFDPETSDLDFVVEFEDYGRGIAKRFIYFANALEALLDRSVDLVFESRMSDAEFRKNVLDTMEIMFDGGRRKQEVA